MSSSEPLKVEFLDIPNPGSAASAELQRQARSHAARAAHARKRHLRTIKYQAEDNMPTSTRNTVGVMMSKVPSPIGPLASHRRDPFTCLVGSLKPIEHFLLDHYMSAVIPRMKVYCSLSKSPVTYLDYMFEEWMGLALDDKDFLNGLFLAASRHLSEKHPQQQFFKYLVIQYKIACVRAVSRAISAAMLSGFHDSTVASAMILAFDEFTVGNLTISRQHVNGAIKMVEQKGGPQTLGLNGFLESALYSIAIDTDPMNEAPSQVRSIFVA